MTTQYNEDITIEVSNIINAVILPNLAAEIVPIILPNLDAEIVPIILPNLASTVVPLILPEEVVPKEDVIEKMIIQSLVDILSKKINDENIKIDLSKESIAIIAKIIKASPDFLNDIEKSLVEIIKDNKIDSNDIPNLITVIQKLYELIYKNKDIKLDNKKCAEISSSVLKFIIHTLIIERKIKINEENQVVILALIDKLIDSCINLISFQNSIKVKGFCKSIFC
jgi:hypothetical protein